MSFAPDEESFRPRRSLRPRRRSRRIFDVPSARRMLPLVRRVLEDYSSAKAELAHEASNRRPSVGPGALGIAAVGDSPARESVERYRAELLELGCVFLEGGHATVGFPTIVNGSLAYLVFRHDDQDLREWRYRDQPTLRAIPASWGVGEAVPEESEAMAVR